MFKVELAASYVHIVGVSVNPVAVDSGCQRRLLRVQMSYQRMMM